ncbi:hypothetical protein DPMN_117966 [Dreissena polymorpha]|uniref:Uncharacterized protein n=1 Tax=Dreissena polymorpha TaxID=45954 RepID=A0A9D4GJY7_DREPO|nr:hypothetical protein DPMN_117966 [Dreissena polymorpha]
MTHTYLSNITDTLGDALRSVTQTTPLFNIAGTISTVRGGTVITSPALEQVSKTCI